MAAACEPGARRRDFTRRIGDNWIVDPSQLRGLRPLAADRTFRGEF